MRKVYIAVAIAVLTVVAGLWVMHRRADASESSTYRTAAIRRGDVQSTVAATGALSAVTTVQVGTQVSGQVSAIYVDFNDKVKKGQLLARIDPTLAQQAVQDAQAGVERVRAQLADAQAEYERNKPLADAKIITATEFGAIQSTYQVALANLKSAQIALDKARQNLSYTSIYAPIDGIVVERNVDVGQTVAASLSAPQLFLIANDLSQMQILASVDESDIGMIKEGQPVRFTVQTYPNRAFTGTVRQVRLQSTTLDNVVNYTAVIAVQNTDGALLPGMTATVSFLTGSANDVLFVPNAALRVRPTAEMIASGSQIGSSARRGTASSATADSSSARGDSARTARATGTASASQRTTNGTRANVATLWTPGANGKLTPVRVRTGITDGQNTAVTGSGLREGLEVVVGITSPDAKASTSSTSTTASPFQPQRPAGGPRGRGF